MRKEKHLSGAVLPRTQLPDCYHGGSARGLGSLGVLGSLGGRSLIVCENIRVRRSDSGLPCKNPRVENYTVKRSRWSLNRRLQLTVDSGSRAKFSWPRLEDRQSGDCQDNRCHRLPHMALWDQNAFPRRVYASMRPDVMATLWVLWVRNRLHTASVSALKSNLVRAMLCPDYSIRR